MERKPRNAIFHPMAVCSVYARATILPNGDFGNLNTETSRGTEPLNQHIMPTRRVRLTYLDVERDCIMDLNDANLCLRSKARLGAGQTNKWSVVLEQRPTDEQAEQPGNRSGSWRATRSFTGSYPHRSLHILAATETGKRFNARAVQSSSTASATEAVQLNLLRQKETTSGAVQW